MNNIIRWCNHYRYRNLLRLLLLLILTSPLSGKAMDWGGGSYNINKNNNVLFCGKEYIVDIKGATTQAALLDFDIQEGNRNELNLGDTVVVTITGNVVTTPYNGDQQLSMGYTVDIPAGVALSENDIVCADAAKVWGTHVGTYNMGLTAASFGCSNDDYHVVFEVTDGSLTITRAPLVVSADNKTKLYGENDPELTANLLGLYSSDSVSYSLARVPGETVGEYAIMPSGDSIQGDYELSFVPGVFSILPAPLSIAIVGSKTYDGSAFQISYNTFSALTVTGLAEGDYLTSGMVSSSAAQVAVYSYPSSVSIVEEFNCLHGISNYVLNYDITLEIQRSDAIQFTNCESLSQTKTYDGAALVSQPIVNVNEGTILQYSVNNGDWTVGEAPSLTDAGVLNVNVRTVNPNYDTVYCAYTLTVTPAPLTLTIVGENSTVAYDDTEHSVSGYTVIASSPFYNVDNDLVFSGMAIASRIDAGTSYMGLTSEQFTNINGNYTNVVFEITDGYQTITPIDVTVAVLGNNNSAEYDASVHSVLGFTLTATSPLYDLHSDFIFSGSAVASRTDVGTSYMGLSADQFVNVNGNFANVTFDVTDGFQTIVPIAEVMVSIMGHSDTIEYDGTAHSVSGYEVETSNPLYTSNDFVFNGTALAVRTDAGTTNMGLSASQFSNTNNNFAHVTFNVTDGYQTINPVAEVVVTIAGHQSTLVYDGAEHSVSGYEINIDNPLYTVDDFVFDGTALASRTDAGTTNMGLSADQFTNLNENFAHVTFNVTDGYQTISPIAEVVVTITGHDNTTVYDGYEHGVSGYEVEIGSSLYTANDFSFDGTALASRTDAGTTNMGLLADQFTNTNANFATVIFNVTDGYQTVMPKTGVTVSVTGHRDTIEYDGTTHSVSGYEVMISDFLYAETDFGFSGISQAERTDVGTTYMGLSSEHFTNTNVNFANVTFEVTDGYQTIMPMTGVTVSIMGHRDTIEYDGTTHSVNGYEVIVSSPLYAETDFGFSGISQAERTDVGTTYMGLSSEHFTNTNVNFANVIFEVTDGYQTIMPMTGVTVNIMGHRDTIEYDGTTHSVNGYEVMVSNPLYTDTDFGFSGIAQAEGIDAGTTYMGMSSEQFANMNANFTNVIFEVTDGCQTIVPVAAVVVTVMGHNSTLTYDGSEHSVSGYDAEISNPLYSVNDIIFNGTALAYRTDAGTTNMGLSANQFSSANSNFAHVTFNVTDGFQTINPVAEVVVTITGHNNASAYDGTEHSVSGYDVEISDSLYTVNDFSFSGLATAARANAGTSYMGLSSEQFENTNINFAHVTFNVTDGYQTINPIAEIVVSITGHSNTSEYNGIEHSVSGYEVEISNPLYAETDFTFMGIDTVARTIAGTSYMGLSSDQFVNTNVNFAHVSFEVMDGYQTISPVAEVTVSITGHVNTIEYDGAAHHVSGYEVEISNPLYTVNDISFSGSSTAFRTNAGTSYMGLSSDQFMNTNANFVHVTFEVTDGYQTINPIAEVEVAIMGHNNTSVFDGVEHGVSGYDVEIGNRLYTEADFTFNGINTAARTNAGTTGMGLSSEQFVNTNANFAHVTFNVTDGYQTINPIAEVMVTITGHSATSVYDGTEHAVRGYEVGIGHQLYAESDFTFNGIDTAARTVVGTTSMGLSSDQFVNTNENFAHVTFVVADGYQTINPVAGVIVTITGHNNTSEYDGIEHLVSGYEVEVSNPLYNESDFSFVGTAMAARTSSGTTYMGLSSNQFANNNNNFLIVTFEVTDGWQQITSPDEVTVSIRGHNNTTEYDGEPHTVNGYDVLSISNPLYTENDFSFSGAATVSRINAGTTNMGLSADQFANLNNNFSRVIFEVTDGYQIITPIAEVVVSVTGHSDTSDYDGTEHSVSGYEVEISNPLYSESDFAFTGVETASRTVVGTTGMGLSSEQFENTNDNFAHVTFNVTDGHQTIEPVSEVIVMVSGRNNILIYDGTEHSVSGYDVEISNPLYTLNDFNFSGTALVSRTNVGTTNMGLSASQFTNTNANFAHVTFEVTDGYQTINPIEEVAVNIIGHNSTLIYDGTEHHVSGYEVEISNPLYTEADFTFNGTDTAARTIVGTSNMALSSEQFVNTNVNFAHVTFNVTDGYQTINPNADVVVTIVGHNSTLEYNGSAHSVNGYDIVGISNPLYTESDFTFSGTAMAVRTDAGTTYMGLSSDQFTNINSNFTHVTFELTDGYQTISPIAEVVVTIAGHNSTSVYDGSEHSVSGYEIVSISNPLYTENDFGFNGIVTVARTDAGTSNMGLSANQFSNTNSNFTQVIFEVTDGWQTVEPIAVTVTITGHQNSVNYDGAEHIVVGYSAIASSTLYDVNSDFYFSGTDTVVKTDAGTSYMGLSAEQFANTDNNFSQVTFEVTDGWLTVNPIDVTVNITGHVDTTFYDGTAHTVTGYSAIASNELYDVSRDFGFSGSAEASQTGVGTQHMGLSASQFINVNDNFATVTFVVTDGWQTIVKAALTITIFDTKTYDGTTLVTAYNALEGVTTEGLVEGDYLTAGEVESNGSEVGTYSYPASAHINEAFDTYKGIDNYNVTYLVTQRIARDDALEITNCDELTKTRPYNGLPLVSVPALNITEGTTVEYSINGGEWTSEPAGITNAGTIEVSVRAMNPNYVTTSCDYTLTVEAVELTVKANDKSRLYYETNPSFDGSITGFVNGEDVSVISGNVSYSSSATQSSSVGIYSIVPDISALIALNYTFRVLEGNLSITPHPIVFTGETSSLTYDGSLHQITAISQTGLISGHSYQGLNYVAEGEHAGEYDGAFGGTLVISDAEAEDVTGNYVATYIAGKLTVNPISGVTVVITGHHSSDVYDGTLHTVAGYDMSASSALYTISCIDFTGMDVVSKKDAGTIFMGLDASQFANSSADFTNVSFEVTDGYQTITPIAQAITITANSAYKVYDGSALTDSGYSYTEDVLLAGDVLFATVSGTLTDVDTVGNVVIAYQVMRDSENVTSNYTFTEPVSGALGVYRRNVILTSASDSKIYDGSALTNNEVAVGGDGFAAGEGASYTVFGSQTEVGSSGNSFDYSLNPNTKAANYNITTVEGTLTVNALNSVTVTIVGHSDTMVYDGTNHSVSGYEVEISNPLYTESDFSFNGTALASGLNAGTTHMGLSSEQFINTNSNFSHVTFNVTDGFLTINPIEEVTVSIMGHNNNSVYDGEDHSVNGYDVVSISNPLYTENDFSFNGTATASRTDAGTSYMGLLSSQFFNTNANFEHVVFEIVDGWQMVNPTTVTVSITGHQNTAEYNGNAHGVSGYEVETSNPLYTENDFSFSGTAMVVRTDAGISYMGLSSEQFSNSNDNFTNVTFEVTDGWQNVTPIDVTVTITGHNNTTNYDGNAHSVSGYDVTISNSLYTVADFIFSGNATASRTDAGTTNMGLAVNQFTNTNTNFANVTFEVTDGWQTVSPIAVTVLITGHNNTANYDGTAHGVSGYDVNISNSLYNTSDFIFSGNATASRTDAGTTNMGLMANQFANTNANFTDVSFVVTDGWQTVNPIDVTVTIVGANSTVDYDGMEHGVSGYVATAGNVLYNVNQDFTFNGETTVSRTEAGTSYMGLIASQFANINTNFANVTFEVTDGWQTVSPIAATVSIVGAKDTADYDGTSHVANGYEIVGISNPLYTENDFVFNGTAVASRTDAGTAYMGLIPSQFVNTNTNFANVTFVVTDGWQTVNPITVTVNIVGAKDTVDYDGMSHVVNGYLATVSNSLYDVNRDFSFGGAAESSRTNTGTTYMGLTANQFVNINANFVVAFEVTDGWLTVNPRAVNVTITGNSNTSDYDGNTHSVTAFTAEADNLFYDVSRDLSFSGMAMAAQTDAGTTYMGLTASQFTNINNNFAPVTFTVVDGYQTINPVGVTVNVVGHRNATMYDGLEHSVSGYDISYSNSLYTASDFTFTGTAIASRTEQGTTTMGLDAAQFANINSNFSPVTFNVTDGYQTITALDAVVVTIVGHRSTTTYDGISHSVDGYEVSISSPLYSEDDFIFNGTASASTTDAGTAYMGLLASQFSNINANFSNVTFEVSDGWQTVSPLAVNFVGESQILTYDGTLQSITDITPVGIVTGHSFAGLTYKAEGMNVGSYPGSFVGTLIIKDASNRDVTSNYAVTKTTGTLTISPASIPLTFTGESDTKVYNGATQTVTNIIPEGLLEGHTYTDLTYSAMGNQVGSYTGAFEGTVRIWSGGVDVSENYLVTEIPGVLEITARDITVSVEDRTLEYNGHEQYGNTAYSFSNLVEGHTATIAYTAAKGTLVSAIPYDNGVYTPNSVMVKDAHNNIVSSNYNLISANTGKLNIIDRTIPYEITVVANSNTGNVYDGTVKTATGFQTLEFMIDGNNYTVESLATSNPSSADVCNMVNEITGTAVVRDADNHDVSSQFIVNRANGILEIAAKPVTVTIEDAQKVYGSADPIFTGTVDGLVNEDDLGVINFSRLNTDENVGTYQDVLTALYAANANYVVTVNHGDFTITRATLMVTADNKTKTYGSSDPVFTATVSGLQRGDDASVLAFSFNREEGENVGSYFIYVDGATVQGNYNLTFEHGLLIVERAALTVIAEDKTKEYANSDPALTATLTGLKIGDSADMISYSLSREEGENVGNYDITATGTTVQGNYNVYYVSGIFSITAAPVTVTAEPKTKTYGDEDPVLTASVSGMKNGDNESVITYDISRAEGENVGAYTITPSGDTEQGNYAVTYNTSMLNITRASVTLSLVSASKVYGDPDPNMIVATGLKNGDDLSVLTFSLTRPEDENIGTKAVTLKVVEREQNNYMVARTTTIAYLTINRAPVTVSADNKVKVYGTADPELTVTITGLKNGDNESVIAYNGPNRVPGESVGTYPITVTGTGTQGNYSVTFQSATFTIVSHTVNVTITGNSRTVTYSGYEQNVSGYSITLPEGTELTAEDIVCSNAAEARGTDVGTYFMGLTSSDFTNTNASYAVVFNVTDGKLTVNRATVRITADSVTKSLGEADPLFTATIVGLRGDDDESVLTYSFTRDPGETVGTYWIRPQGEAIQGNYNVIYRNGKLAIIEAWPSCPVLGETNHIPTVITDRTDVFQAITAVANIEPGVSVSDAYYTIIADDMADVVVPAAYNNGVISADISIQSGWRGKAITLILTAMFNGCGNDSPFISEPQKICLPYDVAPAIVYTGNTSGLNKTDLFRNDGTVILMAGINNRDDDKIAEYGFLISTNAADVVTYNSTFAKTVSCGDNDTITYGIGLDSCTKHLYYKPYLILKDCDSTIVYGQRKDFTMWQPDLLPLTVAPSTSVAQGTEVTLSAVATMTVGSWPQLFNRFVDQLNNGASYHGYSGCYLGTNAATTKNMEEWMHILLDCPLAGNIVSSEMHLNAYDASFRYEWQPMGWSSATPQSSGVTTTTVNQTTSYEASAVFSYRGMECKVSRTITVTVE